MTRRFYANVSRSLKRFYLTRAIGLAERGTLCLVLLVTSFEYYYVLCHYPTRTISIILGVRERVAVAKRLNEGECGGFYGDAILILSAILSGLAADLWPGKGKDRKRFVELWATHARPDLNPNLISVPLLREDIQKSRDTALVNKLSAIY